MAERGVSRRPFPENRGGIREGSLAGPRSRKIAKVVEEVLRLALNMMGEELSGSKEEEELIMMFRNGGSLEYEEEEALEGRQAAMTS